MVRILMRVRLAWWQLAAKSLLTIKGVSYGRGCRFYGLPIIDRCAGSRIVIGDNVVLCSHPAFTALGVNHPVVLRTLRPDALLEIREDCGLSGTSVCAAKSVIVGKRVLIGANVMIFDTDFHARAAENRRYNNDWSEIGTAPVSVEDDVFIGAGSIVAKGVSIGKNSIVGAGAVVVHAIAANSVACGNPARLVADV
jgi:acetyltransferase-like isoleucine patch superfamily enzyme